METLSLSRYTLSLLWHPTLTTGILPFLALTYMNAQIFFTVRFVWRLAVILVISLRRTRNIFSGRESRQRLGEMSLALTLSSIVLMHIVCNALRIFLGVLVVALVGVDKDQTSFFDVCNSFLHRGASCLYGGVRPVHPSPLGDVPRVGGPPPRHAQLLHQLHHLLLRLRPLQKSSFKGDGKVFRKI